jgi:GNAT superfamily N-acetyltransferase
MESKASHYALYMLEAFGKIVIENEEGFIMFWQPSGTTICYIEDIYVAPAYRQTGVTAKFELEAIDWAKARGLTHLMGSVNMRISTPERSISELRKAGYKYSHMENNILYFLKSIGEAE